jgi:cathepsin B
MIKSISLILLQALFAFAIISEGDFKIPAQSKNVMFELNNKLGSTWKAGFNKYFEGKSLGDAKKLMGFKPREDKVSLPIVKKVIPGLPQNFDSSQQWPTCTTIGTIYNQADCGSCWAFGCVEAVSDRFCIHKGSKFNQILSFMDETACGPCDGCEGGDPDDAWSFVQSTGLVTDACYPYSIPTCPPAQQPCLNFVDTPNCLSSCNNTDPWVPYMLSSVYDVSSDASAIQSEIYTNGPVEACFTVYSDFLNYKSGVYQYESGDALGGHCVKIIGWGVEGGLPYWLINNSWTTYWGDNGQFKILRGQDECGIEDDVVAGLP